MIEAHGIKKSYGDLQVLKGIDLTIDKGEIVTILGKSGAGKSTLLHILGTLDRPDAGQCFIDQTDVTSLTNKKVAAFRNARIGFVFQFHHLLGEFNALENVSIPALIKGINKKDAMDKAKGLLDYFGLSNRLDHKPNQLSGGEQQRVAFARALINDPSVVFADEPTGNLDSATSQEMHQLILRLRSDYSQTFVIVTHNEELAKLSDRSIFMESGLLIN